MSFKLWAQRAPTDEAVLVSRLLRGDRLALDHLYRQEAGEVYRFALAMCGNPAWSADATQDAFVQLALQPGGFDPAKGVLRAYLCGIVRHKLLARWRDAGAADGDDADEAAADPDAPSPETLLVRLQSHRALWAAVRELPWPFREALVLVDLQERSYAEAAQIAGVELNTLRTRLHRARLRLAQALSSMYRETVND
ncbi:MAG: RNA polymerase sigma factor [Pseudomonadota bacterium]